MAGEGLYVDFTVYRTAYFAEEEKPGKIHPSMPFCLDLYIFLKKRRLKKTCPWETFRIFEKMMGEDLLVVGLSHPR